MNSNSRDANMLRRVLNRLETLVDTAPDEPDYPSRHPEEAWDVAEHYRDGVLDLLYYLEAWLDGSGAR